MNPIRLGVIFGSKSVEHEVSTLTALQLMKQGVDKSKYTLVPLYIDKQGRWLSHALLLDQTTYKDLPKVFDLVRNQTPKESFSTLPSDHLLNIDVAIVCCHGTQGEDGTVQGLLELANVPYQGPGVLASALCMDKIASKQVMREAGYSTAEYVWFTQTEWESNKSLVLEKISKLQYPLFVKPSNLGSSVGISKVKSKADLEQAIEVAKAFDSRILVEQGIEDVIEVNVSVLGLHHPKASVTEQPIKTDELLSYADKYERGGGKKTGMASLNRRIPAPIAPNFANTIQRAAEQIFTLLDCSGVIRIDFFADPSAEKFWVGEVNTIPGSMSNYLWQATEVSEANAGSGGSGMTYIQLVDELVAIALQRSKEKQQRISSIQTKIL